MMTRRVLIDYLVFRKMSLHERTRVIGEVALYINTKQVVRPMARILDDGSYRYSSIDINPRYGDDLQAYTYNLTARQWIIEIVLMEPLQRVAGEIYNVI